MASQALVGVVIASRSDFSVMRRGLEALRLMGVPYVFEIIAPQQDPDGLALFAQSAGERGIEVLIAASHGSSFLAGQLAAHCHLPVIGVPIDASALRGQDALFSMLMAPTGNPVAVVGINNAENAAVLATQIIALHHEEFRSVLVQRRDASAARMESIRRDLAAEFPDLCDPVFTVQPAVEDGLRIHAAIPARNFAPGGGPIRPGATLSRPLPPVARPEVLLDTPMPFEPEDYPGGPVELAYESGDAIRRLSQDEIETLAAESNADSGADVIADPETHVSPSVVDRSARADVATPPPRYPGVPVHEQDTQPPITPHDSGEQSVEEVVATKVFRIDRENPDEDITDHAMMVLLEGGIVALPTDTVYGLAVDATNRDAVQRLYRLKGRDHQKTMGVLIHHPDMLDKLVREMPPELERVIEKLWPGALTIILPKHPGVLSSVSTSDRIGIRMPNDAVCMGLIAKVGRPIAMRNASITKPEPMVSAKRVVEEFRGHVECILDAGDCPSDRASTVLSALGDRFEVLREGGVPRAELKALLGDMLKD